MTWVGRVPPGVSPGGPLLVLKVPGRVAEWSEPRSRFPRSFRVSSSVRRSLGATRRGGASISSSRMALLRSSFSCWMVIAG
eukprot:7906188-Heterocapsa_arctica.AAC.1